MDQKITVKIGAKTYSLRASSEESERLMRLAAEAVNKRLESYESKLQARPAEDKLAFVALNEAMARLTLQKKQSSTEQEIEEMNARMKDYIDNIGNSR